jgi:ankyrin repeat protein
MVDHGATHRPDEGGAARPDPASAVLVCVRAYTPATPCHILEAHLSQDAYGYFKEYVTFRTAKIIMERKVSLQELIRSAGVTPIDRRQAPLPPPTQPALLASENDHAQARSILLDRRARIPESKGVLKGIFKSSKEKDKTQELGQFSQDELDQALSAVIDNPTSGPGLIQAFVSLGAKVNIIETLEKKKKLGSQPNTGLRRRSTVLQQAASLRKADGVSILASSGADQTTLDEGLKVALTANDHACCLELLRFGANLNNFPNALADVVRLNDLNFVRLLLRAPKPLRTEIISSCLPAAVQQMSDAIISLLVAYGADPNFDSASALHMAIRNQSYKLAVALVAGPIPLAQTTLKHLLDTTIKLPTHQATLQYLQLLFCCGLPPDSQGLSDVLIYAVKQNDTVGSKMMLNYGVSTRANEAECLRVAIANSNWSLVDAILQTSISPQQATAAMVALPSNAPQTDRLRVARALIQKGATGQALAPLLTQAAKEGDDQLISLLVDAGAPIETRQNNALHFAVLNKDRHILRTLLSTHPPPETLASLFPLLFDGYSSSERRETSAMLLEYGAHGPDVDQALVDAVEDAGDRALVTELVRRGADVDYKCGAVISLAATQKDVTLLRLLCNARPNSSSTSAALLLAFDSQGGRHPQTLEIIELLLSHGIDEDSSLPALQIAITGGAENIDIIMLLLTASPKLLSPALEFTVAIQETRKKAPILDALLKMEATQEALDRALATETRHAIRSNETASIKLLLDKGASVNYNDGEALSVAVTSRSASVTELLLGGRHQSSRSSVTKAFRAMFAEENISSHSNIPEDTRVVAEVLLRYGIEQPAIESALQVVLSDHHYEHDSGPLIDLLLQYDADVSVEQGVCFVYAAQKQDLTTLEKLMLHNPNFSIVIPTLLSSKLDDEVIIIALDMCFKHGCTLKDLHGDHRKPPILLLAMGEYPRNASLITLLLDNGLDADIQSSTIIHPSMGTETITALLWALNQPQKHISDAIMIALLEGGATATSVSPTSETTALHIASREGRHKIVSALLERGSDADARDIWNKSPLFYASACVSGEAIVKTLAERTLKNDGSLHEAARELSIVVVRVLLAFDHDPNFPSRLHGGRNALGELCLNASVETASQRSNLRHVLRILLAKGANPKFRARNEKSVVNLALDNAYSALPITEALLETEVWQDLNNQEHIYRDSASGLHYSLYSYVDRLPSPARSPIKQQLLDLLRDKACLPVYYSESPLQPVGATGIPPATAKLVEKQKEHELALRHENEKFEHSRSIAETAHKDALRRNREAQEAQLAAQTTANQHWTTLEQQKHDFEVHRVREAERMKRGEKVAWHNLLMEQERDAAARRQSVDDRKASAAMALELEMSDQRKQELEHRAGVERMLMKEKEEHYERNVKRQKEVRQIAGPPQWGTVD